MSIDIDGYDSDDFICEYEPHDFDDLADDHCFWHCVACGAQNSSYDGECQYCECGGLKCKRDSCSEPEHFHAEHVAEGEPLAHCSLCTKGGT